MKEHKLQKKYEVRILVLTRDNYECQHEGCNYKEKPGMKNGDSKLECHDIIYKEDGGQYVEENLVTICGNDHNEHHKGKLDLVLKKTGVILYAKQIENYAFKRNRMIWRKGIVTAHKLELGKAVLGAEMILLLLWCFRIVEVKGAVG